MTNPPIPERGSALTADWMHRALAAGGAHDLPAIRDMEVGDIGTGAGALSEILRCTMRYEEDGAGAPESVVVKLCSSDKKSLRIARLLGMYRREYNLFGSLRHTADRSSRLVVRRLGRIRPSLLLVLEDLQGMEAMDQIPGWRRAPSRPSGVAQLHVNLEQLDRAACGELPASVPHRDGGSRNCSI